MVKIKKCEICKDEKILRHKICEEENHEICEACYFTFLKCVTCEIKKSENIEIVRFAGPSKHKDYLYKKSKIRDNWEDDGRINILIREIKKTYREIDRSENDYFFKTGKYKNKWLSEFIDEKYIKWYIEHNYIDNNVSDIFKRYYNINFTEKYKNLIITEKKGENATYYRELYKKN